MIKFLLSALFLNACTLAEAGTLDEVTAEVARTMPDFELNDINHDSAVYRSADHAGAVFVIEFYFAGCPACNSNAPNFKRLATEFKDNANIQFVEVSIDCADSAYETWISRHKPFVPVLNACDKDFTSAMGVQSFPTTSIVSRTKAEALRGSGVWSSQTYARLKKYLSQVAR